MAELDLVRLRELAAELGYWAASTDEEHVARTARIPRGGDAVNYYSRCTSSLLCPGRVLPCVLPSAQ
jgi:hypothetical protein